MSGAGRMKGDGSDEQFLYEVKDAAGKNSYRITEAELRTLWKQSAKEGKEPVFVIVFGEFTLRGEIETS